MATVRSTTWKFYAFSFFRGIRFFSAVLIPFFIEWGNISMLQISFLQSWFMLWVFLLEVPTGVIADYFGRKYSLAVGALIWVIANIVYSSIPNFWLFLIAEFFAAAAYALMSGADQALLYDSLKEKGQEAQNLKISGRAKSFEFLGMSIAGPIGSLIAYNFGLQYPMFFTIIPSFITFLIALSFKEPKTRSIKETKRYSAILKEGVTYFYKHQTLRILAIDTVLVGSSAYFVIWFYQRVLQNINIDVFYFGFFYALLVGTEVLISSNFVFLEKIVGSAKNLIRFTALATAGSFILVAQFQNLTTLIIFLIFAGGFGLTRMNLMTSYMQKFIPSEQRATVLSSVSMLGRFVLIILNPIIGFIADKSLNSALLILGIIPLAVFLFSPIEKQDL